MTEEMKEVREFARVTYLQTKRNKWDSILDACNFLGIDLTNVECAVIEKSF